MRLERDYFEDNHCGCIRSALLIGVPSENISGSALSGAAPPILLSPSNDKRPLPAVIFAGASLMALGELLVHVENGIPIIVLQDSCELCVVLHSAYLLYRSAQFEHSKFVTWLEEQLDAIAIGDVATATITVVKIFATAFGDTQLIEFLDSDEVKLYFIFLRCAADIVALGNLETIGRVAIACKGLADCYEFAVWSSPFTGSLMDFEGMRGLQFSGSS
ncbi:hypothetical protein TELCIR_21550 [Teladorsagia circumcincta]|uniref:Uncharacterized protein n=1 Tax=Teladorsagia circumcincta TaxID=45464 RepID=A0A2G9TGM1_TELCI|nr:hypothetical protein TELCIR_21550 [Teladorsagia circumcincta]